MKIVVCVRQGTDGELSPFDACAYEEALKIEYAEVTLLSMGPSGVKDLLLKLTRLGAKRAVLLTDPAFAGADTLATAVTLAAAVKKLQPDLIFSGRQTLIGDTGQVGVMLAQKTGFTPITNVMKILAVTDKTISCHTRDGEEKSLAFPCLLTIERINQLRLPSILSKPGTVEVWNAADLGVPAEKCGLAGSPTRVLKTFENQSGKRKCRYITADELLSVIENAGKKETTAAVSVLENKLPRVMITGETPRAFAQTVSDDITVLDLDSAKKIAEAIKEKQPNAVLFGSDIHSKQIAASVAAMLDLGLCADCTRLETDGETLIMYRPAMSGSVIAKIESLTKPAMATVRTEKSSADTVVAAGYGAKDCLAEVKAFAEKIGAQTAASRKAVDHDLLPYESQVGLTGKTVAPAVYIAVGVSGAVHHIVGIQKAGTVIAINPDQDAPIFDYADYGILSDFKTLWEEIQ